VELGNQFVQYVADNAMGDPINIVESAARRATA
jgi:hypothetical protein